MSAPRFRRLSGALALVLLLGLTAAPAAVAGGGASVTVNTTDGRDYYHLSHGITRGELVALDQLSRSAFFRDGGQFEVRLRQSGFPVPAPACESDIILRMPWTGSGRDKVARKYELYRELAALAEGRRPAPVRVVIELNPYVRQRDSGYQLTQCNAFFRHADGAYIPHTNPLDRSPTP